MQGMEPTFLVVVAALAGISSLLLRLDRQRVDDMDAIWAQAATTLGGEYEGPGNGLFRAERYAIRAIGRAPVLAQGVGGKGATTHAKARIRRSWGLELRVAQEGILSSLGKSVGLVRDVAVGDARFDEQYVVSANDPALARAWLTPKLRAMVCASELKSWLFAIERGDINVSRTGLPETAREVVAAIRLAGALAERATELHTAWNELADRIGGVCAAPSEGALPVIQVTERTIPVEITHTRVARSSVTRVRALETLKAREEAPLCDLDGLVIDPDVVRNAVEEVVVRAGAVTGAYR